MTDKTDNGITARLIALLGKAASKTTTTESCPTDQQLADFIQGHLKNKVQQRVLTHVNDCPDCRQAWLDTSAYMEIVALEQSTRYQQKKTRSPGSRFSNKPLLTASIRGHWQRLDWQLPHFWLPCYGPADP